MKPAGTIIITTCLLLNIFQINAQAPLMVREEIRKMSKGSQNAFVLEVPQTKASELKKEWQKYLRENSKIKTEEFKGELYALQTVINRISGDPLNHYALFSESPAGSIITAFYAINDSFISTANMPAVATAIQKFMFDFGKSAYIRAVEKEVELEQKTLRTKENELEMLLKEEDKLQKSIVEHKSKIESNENEIKVKKQEQDLKQKEIMMQKEKMLGINLNPEEKKLQDKIIKEMESEKQKLIKAQGNLRKSIHKSESYIRQAERNIANLKSKQDLKRNEIHRQREIAQKAVQKLDKIKKM
jgi:cob(I)alamin adenosyltransferase